MLDVGISVSSRHLPALGVMAFQSSPIEKITRVLVSSSFISDLLV